MTCLRLSASPSASVVSTSSSCLPALYIVSFARIILMATSGLLPSGACRSLSVAVTTLEKMPLPLALTTSYLLTHASTSPRKLGQLTSDNQTNRSQTLQVHAVAETGKRGRR